MTDVTDDIREFPTTRSPGCPFDPDPALLRIRVLDRPPKVHCPADIDAYVFTGYEQVRQILAAEQVSSRGASSFHAQPGHDFDQPIYPGNLLQTDGKEHQFLRQLLMPEFTVRRTRELLPYIERVIHEHLDAVLANGPGADLVADLATGIPSLVICQLLGVPPQDRPRFIEWAWAMMNTDNHRDQQIEPGRLLMGYMYAMAAEKLKLPTPPDDLMGRLITRSREIADRLEYDRPPLTVEELGHLSLVLLVAGSETTANMIGLSTLLLLTEQQSTLRALRADPSLAEVAVEEMLRFLTVIQFGVLRRTTAELTVGDHTIGPEEWVVASLAGGNRDPRAFADPGTVDIGRPEPQRHLAFGWGAHQCAGKQLARTEIIAVHRILHQRIPTLRLAVPIDELPFKTLGMVYGLKSLPVTWDA